MASKKPSAKARRIIEFKAQLGGLDDVFGREERRCGNMSEKRRAVLREKACKSKNRYQTSGDAQLAIEDCAAHGATGLRSYRCPYCRGWHLTSSQAGDQARP